MLAINYIICDIHMKYNEIVSCTNYCSANSLQCELNCSTLNLIERDICITQCHVFKTGCIKKCHYT